MSYRRYLASPLVSVVAAVAGGVALGFGIGRVAGELRRTGDISVPGAVWSVLGLIVLWWALNTRRQANPENPESEADGSHTIE